QLVGKLSGARAKLAVVVASPSPKAAVLLEHQEMHPASDDALPFRVGSDSFRHGNSREILRNIGSSHGEYFPEAAIGLDPENMVPVAGQLHPVGPAKENSACRKSHGEWY